MDIGDDDDNELVQMDDSIIPIAYTFRFTFSDQDKDHEYITDKPRMDRWKIISKNLVEKISQMYDIPKITGGFETLNKKGDRTWAHIHIHFYTTAIKESMSRVIKRYLGETYDMATVGIKAYSFKAQQVRSAPEFWQYPLKQNLSYDMCRGFTNAELDFMHRVAKTSYSKTVEINQKKIDNRDTSDTLFERLEIWLKKSTATNKRILLMKATEFYIQEDRPIMKPTIEGYVNTYMLKNKLLTLEEFWQ